MPVLLIQHFRTTFDARDSNQPQHLPAFKWYSFTKKIASLCLFIWEDISPSHSSSKFIEQEFSDWIPEDLVPKSWSICLKATAGHRLRNSERLSAWQTQSREICAAAGNLLWIRRQAPFIWGVFEPYEAQGRERSLGNDETKGGASFNHKLQRSLRRK